MRRIQKQDVGDNIRARKKALGIGKQEFADLMGVTRVTVWRWETGRSGMDLDSLDLAGQVLECDPRRLLDKGYF